MDRLLEWLGLLGRGAFALVATIVPHLTFLCLCLGLWVAPRWFGLQRLEEVQLLLAFEFFNIGLAGMMVMTLKADVQRLGRGHTILFSAWLVGISAFLVYNIGVKGGIWLPVVGFWALAANRIAAWWRAPNVRARAEGLASGLVSLLFYVGAILLTSYAPIPALGITRQVIADAWLGGKDLWGSEPQRALAFGVLYFGLQAFFNRPLAKKMA